MKVGDVVTLRPSYRDHSYYGEHWVVTRIERWPSHISGSLCFYADNNGVSAGPWNTSAFDVVDRSNPW